MYVSLTFWAIFKISPISNHLILLIFSCITNFLFEFLMWQPRVSWYRHTPLLLIRTSHICRTGTHSTFINTFAARTVRSSPGFERLSNCIIHQAIVLENCPQMTRQVFESALKKNLGGFGFQVFWEWRHKWGMCFWPFWLRF